MGDVIARITNKGAKCSGEQQTLGRFFIVDKFSVGFDTVGCDPVTLLPVVPDVTATVWPEQTSGQLENIDTIGNPPYLLGPRITVYPIVIPDQYKNRQISSIGLYGTYVYTNSPDDTSIIGKTFLYAIANFGLVTVPAAQQMIVTLKVNIF